MKDIKDPEMRAAESIMSARAVLRLPRMRLFGRQSAIDHSRAPLRALNMGEAGGGHAQPGK
jgi:hypothetical protein